MSRSLTLPRFAALVDGIEMTPDLITGLVTAALMQGDVVKTALYETVIPDLAPSKRAFPNAIARSISRGEIFDDSFARDLETLITMLDGQIKDCTHVYWNGDDNHVRGGYECTFTEPGAAPLKAAVSELDLLHDTVLACLSASRALRKTTALIEQ